MSEWPTNRWLEVATTLVLGTAALASSWSGYQSTLWNGEQARDAIETAVHRSCASRAADLAGTQRTMDVVVFVSWLAAVSGRDDRLKKFYERRARPEFQPALQAWLATQPGVNPDAPPHPFAMPQYRLAADADVARCDSAAARTARNARDANAISDHYMLATVLFALVMFFATTVHDAKSRDVRVVLLAMAVLATIAGFVHLGRLPLG